MLKASEARLAADLDAMRRLHAVSTRLIRRGDLGPLLEDILEAAIDIAGADCGNIQMLDLASGALKIAAHRGFERPFLEFFQAMPSGTGASCGQAMERGERVIVEDVTQSPIFAGTEALKVLLAAGVRSAVSTPLISRTGQLLGVMSTHRRVPHRPEERVLRLMDLLARQAADAIGRVRAGEALRRSYEELEEKVRERTADLTQANAALKETTRMLEELVKASPMGIFVLDPEGKVLLWNPAMEKILGWKEEEVRGKLPPTVAAGQNGAKETLERLLAGENLAGVELRRVRKDGQPVDLRLWNAPIREESGRLRSAVNVFQDITQLKEMEQIALAQQKLASLGQVAAGIAHEIRNPLSGINLYLHSLETFLGEMEIPDPEVRETAETVIAGMKGASARMEAVIQRVLAFSRPGPPRMEPFDVNACIREAVDMTRVSLQKAGVQVAVALREDVPACLGDMRLVAQALLNLLANAAQAMEGQEGERVIEIRSSRSSASSRNGFVTVSVADSGPGVPPEIREKIFDPFFTTKNTGTGIGLSITHKIVTDHGGSIKVGTSRWGGALFTIGLPAGDKRKI